MGRTFSPLLETTVGGCVPGPLAQAGISRAVGAQSSPVTSLALGKRNDAESP